MRRSYARSVNARLRTTEETRADAEAGVTEFGVLTRSPLFDLNQGTFDLMWKCGVECMHGFDIGLMKVFLERTFGGDSMHANALRRALNDLIDSLKTVREQSWRPRRIEDLARYKASELQLFALALLPCLFMDLLWGRSNDDEGDLAARQAMAILFFLVRPANVRVYRSV